MVHIYPEKTLQLAAVQWMTANWSYRELIGDAEATGDRMDSVGILKGAPVVIEVKTAVNRKMVRFDGTTSNALEAKIGATVGGLYRGEVTSQLSAIRRHWDEITPITVGVLAGSYSADALVELKAMLEIRSQDWWFNGVVWRWTGSVVETLFSTGVLSQNGGRHWQKFDVPRMVGASPKRAAPSLHELREVALSLNVVATFDSFMSEIEQGRFRIQRRPTGIAVADPSTGRTIVALFLDRSDATQGINVGIDCERLNCEENELPGKPAPRAGFLNSNRFFSSTDQVQRLFRLMQSLDRRIFGSAGKTSAR